MKGKRSVKFLGVITLILILFSISILKNVNISNANSEEVDEIEFSAELNKEKSDFYTNSQGYDVFKIDSNIAVDIWLDTPNADLTYCSIDPNSDNHIDDKEEKVVINPELSSLNKYISTENGTFIFDSESTGDNTYLTSKSKIKLATFYFKLSFSSIDNYTDYKINKINSYVNVKRNGTKLDCIDNQYKYVKSELPTKVTYTLSNSEPEVGSVTEIKPMVYGDVVDGDEIFDCKDSTCQKVIAESDNPSILKIFYDGNTVKVKAMAEGEANLKVSSALDPTKYSTSLVKVHKSTQTAVSDFTITNPVSKLHIYDNYKLNINIEPIDAKNADLIYVSSDPSVVTIDNDGKINALKTGKTTITIYCGTISKTMDLEVVNEVTSIKILNPLAYGNGGATYYVKCKVEPEDKANYVRLKFTGSNLESPNDVKQYYSNSYSVFKLGRVKVTAYVGDVEDSYYIDIGPQLSVVETEGVKINNKRENIETNKTYKLDATVIPLNAPNNKISYTSSNNAVATIDENGVITTLAPGTTTITASTSIYNGVATDSFDLIVHSEAIPLNKIELQEKSVDLKASQYSEANTESKKIYINYDPDNTTMSKDITCKSANTNIANVTTGRDSTGRYIEVKAGSTIGTTTITIKSTENEELQDTLNVRTYGVDFKEHYPYLSVGETYATEYISDFLDETEKITNVKYDITKIRPFYDYNTTGKVISVDENTGVITALGNGTATVRLTVTTNKGKIYTTECNVTSKVKVDKITIDKDVIEVPVGSKSTDWGYTINIEPKDAYDRYTTISSSNENIVGFDESRNYLVALNPGEATIKVKSNSSDDVYATMVVKVVNQMHSDRRVVEAEPSTCVKNGHGKYEICNTCGEIVSGSDELLPLDPNNHVNTELRNIKKASLTEEGYTGDLYCKDCGTLLEKGHTTEKLVEKIAQKPAEVIEVVKVKTGGNKSLNIIKILVIILVIIAIVLLIGIRKQKNKKKEDKEGK